MAGLHFVSSFSSLVFNNKASKNILVQVLCGPKFSNLVYVKEHDYKTLPGK